MAEDLGTIRGSIILDVSQAINAYTAARQEHLSTVSALGAAEGAFRQVGVGFTAAGAAIATALIGATNAAGEFERKLDFFAAVSNSTQQEYDEVRLKALELGKDTVYSAGQIAESFIELGKSGVKAQDIIDGIGAGVAALGAAADIPLDTAANIITSAVQTFRLGADQAVDVANKLAGAANASIVDVQDLGTSLKYAGGVASALGVPFEDVNTALALLGTYGIRGSTAGTSLRQTLLSLNGTTAKAQKALEGLGIITEDGTNKFYDQNGSAKSLAEVFQILQEATAGYTDEQRLATLQQIFATRALPTVNALMREGAAGFAEMSAEIQKTTAFDVASQRLDNLSGDLEYLRGEVETFTIRVGESMQGAARDFIQGIEGMVAWLNTLDDGTLSTIVTIAGIVAVILTIIGVMGLFASALLNIIQLGIVLTTVFPVLGSILGGLATAFRVLWGAVTGPIGLIIAAIALVVGALIWFFTETELGREIWANFMKWLQEAWTNVSAFFVDLWTNVSTFFVEAWTNIVNFVTTIINGFVSWWQAVWQGIVDFLTPIFEVIYNVIKFYIEAWINVFLVLAAVLVTIWNAIVEAVTWVWEQIWGFIEPIVTAIVSFLTDTWNNFMLGWRIIWAVVSSVFQSIWNNIVNFLTPIINRIVSFITSAVKTVQSIWNTVWGAISSFFKGIWAGFVSAVQGPVNTIMGIIKGIQNTVMGVFKSVGTWLYNVGRDLIQGFINGIKNMAGTVINAVGDVVNGAVSWAKDVLNIGSPSKVTRYEVGQPYGQGFALGILDEQDNVQKAADAIVPNMSGTVMALADFYDEVAAAKELEVSLALNDDLTSFTIDAQNFDLKLDALATELEKIAAKDTFNIEKLEVNNAEREPASDSLPNAIRKTTKLLEG